MKNRIIRSLFIFLCICLLTGCLSTGGKPQFNKVFVTNLNRVDILEPAAIKNEIEQYQYFEGSFGDQSFAATLYLEAGPEGIEVLLLNEFGIEMGSISYDGQTAKMESSLFPKNLKCEYIILDLQNAYADPEILKNHYANYSLNFEYSEKEGVQTRKVLKKDKLIEEIHVSEKTVTIQNHLRGYTYKLTVLDD